jgi:hypothetical protein
MKSNKSDRFENNNIVPPHIELERLSINNDNGNQVTPSSSSERSDIIEQSGFRSPSHPKGKLMSSYCLPQFFEQTPEI